MYLEFLFQLVEKQISERRCRMRRKFISEIKMKCDPKNSYQERNFFVENKIEDNQVFFKNFRAGTDDFVQTYHN